MNEIRITKTTQSVIDSLLEHIAIMDRNANIVATNTAWDNFALENGAVNIRRCAVGANYLQICTVAVKNDKNLENVVCNLRDLLNGRIDNFTYEYPCHSPDKKRWFLLYATPFIVDDELLGVVVSHINITDRKLAELEAIRFAKYDFLTDALNRRFGIEKLEREIDLADRYRHKFTICFIDIDNLKYVNDNLGHNAGDKLIKKTARLIKDNLRKTDMVIRMGGDEFLIIFPLTGQKEAREVLDRITGGIDDKEATGLYDFDISYGLAEYDPERKLSADKLIESADRKMYKHKTSKNSSH